MLGLAEEAKVLRANVMKLEHSFRTKSSRIRVKRKSVYMKVTAEQNFTECVEQMACVIHLEGGFHEVKSSLIF